MIPASSRCSLHSVAVGAVLSACASTALAFDVGPVAVRGTLSATASYSGEYNYQGKTKDQLDLNVLELTVNGSHQFQNGIRASAQVYAYQYADYEDVVLDFATLSYSFNEGIGVRVGRNKIPLGLYGEVLDLDIVRPFAFLPLDVYPKGFRAMMAASDGAGVFGQVSLKSLGNVEYQLYYGLSVGADGDEPYFRTSDSGTPAVMTGTDVDDLTSGSLYWNTPVDGLRLGTSFLYVRNVEMFQVMRPYSELSMLTNDARGLAYAFPQPAWDAIVAGRSSVMEIDYLMQAASVEYTRGDWQFAAEYFWSKAEGVARFPQPLGDSPADQRMDAYYGMVTYQVAPKLQLGAYYAESYGNKHDRDGSNLHLVPGHTTYLKDVALAASYSLTDWWLVKLEGHALRGTKGVGSEGNGDATHWKRNWNYVVLKSTISF